MVGLLVGIRVKKIIRARLIRVLDVINYMCEMLYVCIKTLIPTCHWSLLPSLLLMDCVEWSMCSSDVTTMFW